MSDNDIRGEDAVTDDRAACKSDRVCPVCGTSSPWSRVYCDCGVDFRTGLPPGGGETPTDPVSPALAQRTPPGAGSTAALSILMRSLSFIWDNKSVIAVHVGAMVFLGWVAGAATATLWSQDSGPNAAAPSTLNLLQAFASMELLRLLLVHGTFLSLSGQKLAPLEFVVLARDPLLIARGATVVLAELLEFVVLAVLSLVFPVSWWLASRLFILSPVASLESHGVTASFRRAWTLTDGHGWVLFRVLLILSSLLGVALLGSVPLAALAIDLTGHDGAATVVLRLVFASYGAIAAVMTVVAYYDVLSPAKRSQLLRYWTSRISREPITTLPGNGN